MSRMSREDFLDELGRSNPRTRRTTVRRIEGRASQDGAPYVQEELNFVDPDLTVRSVNYIGTRTCDFGHLLDQQTRLVAVCERCGAYTCSAPGSAPGSTPVCSFTCLRCGAALCRRHVRVYEQNEAYCSRCMPLVWLRWLIVGKRG